MNVEGLSKSRAWILCLVATFTMAISYIDRQTLAVIASTVQHALSISDTQYGWLVSAFSISYLLCAPLAGRFIDAIGARRGLLAAVLAWTLVAIAHAFVPTFGTLFFLRILLGATESPSFPGAAQTVYRALPAKDHARGIGILFTGSSIGAMIAPVVATHLLSKLGWRGAFIGTALVGLVWVPLWLFTAYSKQGKAALDAKSVMKSSNDVSGSTFEMLKHRAVLRAAVLVLVSAPLIGFLINWGAKILEMDGIPRTELGSYLWIPPLAFDLGAIGFGDLASRRRARRLGDDSRPDYVLVFAAAVLATMIALYPLHRGPWSMILISSIAMMGGGGIFALLTSDMLARVAPEKVSLAGGITAAAQSLAYIVCNPLVGMAVDRFHSYNGVCIVLGCLVLPGTLLWVVLKPPPYYSAIR